MGQSKRSKWATRSCQNQTSPLGNALLPKLMLTVVANIAVEQEIAPANSRTLLRFNNPPKYETAIFVAP